MINGAFFALIYIWGYAAYKLYMSYQEPDEQDHL